MRQDLIDSLGRWVEQGGILLVEQPDERWSGSTGIHMSASAPRVTRRLTAADGLPFRGRLKDALMGIPLTTTMVNVDLGLSKGRLDLFLNLLTQGSQI